MIKPRFSTVVTGILLGVIFARAGVSVGLKGEVGYADWVGVMGRSWAIAPAVYWHHESGAYGFGFKTCYGSATLVRPDPTWVVFSHFEGIASVRFYPLSFLFIEFGGGYGVVHKLEHYDLWLEYPPEPPIRSPIIEYGIGARFRPKGGNFSFDVEAKHHHFLWFLYLNPSLRLGLSYDLGRKEPVQIAEKPRKPKKPKEDGKAGKLPPTLKMSLALDEPSGNKALDAEETGYLVVKLENYGPGIGENLTVKVASSRETPGLSFASSLQIATLEVNESKQFRIPLEVASDVRTRVDTLFVEVEEPRFHNNVLPTPIAFQVYQFAPPDLAMSEQVGIHDEANPKYRTYGNGDSRIQAGETVLITAVVENRGDGSARDVRFSLTSQTPNVVVLDTVYKEMGALRSTGGWDSLSFLVLIPTVVKSDSIHFSVKLEEERERFSKYLSWALPMNAELPTEVVMVSPHTEERDSIAELPRFYSDVDFVEPRSGVEPNTDAIAVVIGASGYQNKDVADVEYARRDMSAVREHLINVLGFEKENVYSVPDPTLADFTTWFGSSANPHGKLERRVKMVQAKEVFVYYSGHGVPSIETGEPYLVPVDCDPNYPEQGGYSLKQLYANLNTLQVEQVTVVIDACFSGVSPEGTLLKGASPLIMEPIDFKAYTPSGFTALTAASGREVANWLDSEQHGLFTYYFLKGLEGSADNGDNLLTWGELKGYVERNVQRAAAAQDRDQTPVFLGDESRVLAEWR